MASLWEELVPGIHDDITLTHIVTRLPWKTLYILSSVNWSWLRAIRSGEVHRARSRSESTETLVAIQHTSVNERGYPKKNRISLYSMRERAFYELPPIAQIEGKMSRYSHFISVESKLYVLGASAHSPYRVHLMDKAYYGVYGSGCIGFPKRAPTHILDLGRQKQWEECNFIQEPEREYKVSIGCGFKYNDYNYVQGGCADWFKSFWQVGHSVDKKWRAEVQESRAAESEWENLPNAADYFTVQGKHYRIMERDQSQTHFFVAYDENNSEEGEGRYISYYEIALEIAPLLEPRDVLRINFRSILPLNNELLALVQWKRRRYWGGYPSQSGFCLLQSKGFGTEMKEIVWERPPQSSHMFSEVSAKVCPIQI